MGKRSVDLFDTIYSKVSKVVFVMRVNVDEEMNLDGTYEAQLCLD